MTTPLHKNPCPRGYKIYNFGILFLGHHYYTLSLYRPCTRVEKKILRKTSILTSPLERGGHEVYNFLSPYPTDATYNIWLKLAHKFLRRC